MGVGTLFGREDPQIFIDSLLLGQGERQCLVDGLLLVVCGFGAAGRRPSIQTRGWMSGGSGELGYNPLILGYILAVAVKYWPYWSIFNQ